MTIAGRKVQRSEMRPVLRTGKGPSFDGCRHTSCVETTSQHVGANIDRLLTSKGGRWETCWLSFE